MQRTWRDIISLASITIGSTLALWLPFLLNLPNFWGIQLPGTGFETVWRNFDGLNYVIVAKTFYSATLIQQFPQTLPAQYFAAHLPGFPLLIFFGGFFTNYIHSMLLLTVATSVAATVAFYLFIKELKLSADPFWLSLVFLFLPARWLVVRSVGSPEPLFIAAMLISLLYFAKAMQSWRTMHFLLAGLAGAVAMVTRSPAILLFVGYTLYLVYWAWHKSGKRIDRILHHLPWRAWPLSLMPLALFAVFWLFAWRMGDFWAYFHSGDNIHLLFPPLQVFNAHQPWVGEIWLEDIIFYFFIYTLTIFLLWKKGLDYLAIIGAVFLIAIISVAHRDIARYSLPLAPFAFVAFDDVLQRKEYKIVFFLLLLAIFLYAINFMAFNTFTVSNFGPYL